jgi:hypothetical protein
MEKKLQEEEEGQDEPQIGASKPSTRGKMAWAIAEAGVGGFDFDSNPTSTTTDTSTTPPSSIPAADAGAAAAADGLGLDGLFLHIASLPSAKPTDTLFLKRRGNTLATIDGVTVTVTATPWLKPTETSTQHRPDRHGGFSDGHGGSPDGGPHGGSHDGHGDGPGGGPHGGGGDKPTSTSSIVSPSSSFTVSPSSGTVPMLDHEAPASGGERPGVPMH